MNPLRRQHHFCIQCREVIEPGAAYVCIQLRHAMTRRFYFHSECHSAWSKAGMPMSLPPMNITARRIGILQEAHTP